ncbi:MAG: ribonuclease R family protein [Alphaproteobacteria bacterium]
MKTKKKSGNRRKQSPEAITKKLKNRGIGSKAKKTPASAKKTGAFSQRRNKKEIWGIYDAKAGRLIPQDGDDNKDVKRYYSLKPTPELANLPDGSLIIVQLLPKRHGLSGQVELKKILGSPSDPTLITRLALAEHDIPQQFSPAALEFAENAIVPPLGKREDLRDLPLVTIDGVDAKDFDDAVWAEKDGDGWHAMVAIADVAYYVPLESALDLEARERGNSCYFPGMVIPMLPEFLSNGLCSLRPHEPRACLAFHLWIDKDGQLVRHQLVRGLMQSVARLTYEQVQAAVDGEPDTTTKPLLEKIIQPLYGVYLALLKAREARGTLDLDIPEYYINLGGEGNVESISQRQRLDSHKLVEELMIAANVAAAETLEKANFPCVYRVHDKPDSVKIDALKPFLQAAGLRLPKLPITEPLPLKNLLDLAENVENRQQIHEMVLRAQSQAVYSPQNIGHFGLALASYAHFTSPIRRYADLMVHRLLIDAYGLGKKEKAKLSEPLEEICKQISITERRAIEAERDVRKRYQALYISKNRQDSYAVQVSGLSRAGLFVRLADSGAEGLVPMRLLPGFFHLDEAAGLLKDNKTKKSYKQGDQLTVTLKDSNWLQGRLTFAPIAAPQEKKTPLK